MEVGAPLSCPFPAEPLKTLFKERRSENEQQLLREEMRSRLHPITCRICRQEMTYFRDVGRFPLEEREVQGAYLAGRGYRFLLTVWWGRVADHLPMNLKEMPAVSSYYRHMSFHLGIRTERDGGSGEAEASSEVPAVTGAFSTSPSAPNRLTPPDAPAAPSFPVVIPVPVPESAESGAWAPARVEGVKCDRSVLRMAKTMVDLNGMSQGRPVLSKSSPPAGSSRAGAEPSEGWLGRAAGGTSTSGGYAVSLSAPGSSGKGKRNTSHAH